MGLPVAIVLTAFHSGGTERQTLELVRRLDRARFTVHLACFHNEGVWKARAAEAADSVTEFPLGRFFSVGALCEAWRFVRWCSDRGIAVLHAADFYANVFALPCAALARVPVRIGSRRGMNLDRSGAQRFVQRLAYTFAHRIVANSQAAADCVVAEGIRRAKLVVIPNGLDLERFGPREPNQRGRTIVTVANLRPGKGHDVLLDAAVDVIRRYPDATFVLVGDGALRGDLEARARALQLTSRFRFLGARDDVASVLRDADVFAFPSLSEASPNAVLEAMAAGLPVVATDVGGIPELIRHDVSGVLVPPGDSSALARGLLDVLEAPERAARLGAAARAAAQSRDSMDRMVQRFEDVYLGVMPGAAISVPGATRYQRREIA